MSETPERPPEDRPTEPFTRGRIQWGRPPQQVFQVGPLPQTRSRPQARPARTSGASILSGSMIPQARPAAPEVKTAPVPSIETEIAPETVAAPVAEPVVATPAPEPGPEPIAAAPEIVVEPEVPEPALTQPPPLSSEAKTSAKPRSLPSVVVTPAIYASVGAAMQKVAKNDRWLVVAGIAAVAVIGGFIWLATMPGPQPVDPTPTPMIAETPVADTPMAADTPPAAVAPTPVAPVTGARSAPAADPAPTPAPEPRRASPPAPVTAAPAPVEAAPRPYIETAPLVVEPPTPAAPPPTDPDAPIATRPQPLD